MYCPTCNDGSPLVFNVQTFLNSSCNDNCDCLSSKYVCYQGANLSCSGILEGDDLETALTKIDEQICSAIGDYSTYQKNCLPTWFGQVINDEATFVDAITAYTCTIASNLESFTGVTFPQYQSQVAAQISSIDGPAITCASASVNSGDPLNTVLTKYCTKFGQIDTALDLSVVDFGACFSVVGTPSTVIQGFVEVLSQICQVKAIAEDGTGILPTFNNIGSCLASPGSNDSLVDTVEKIRDKLCTLDVTYDPDLIDWACYPGPDAPSLQEDVQFIIDVVSDLNTAVTLEYSDDFVVELANPSDPCQGKKISLATPINQDRFVASDSSDTSPGTLFDKLVGNGIDIDNTTTPGQIILTPDHQVLADVADDTPDFLIGKLNGSTINGITITPTYNPSTKQVDLILSIDQEAFCAAIAPCFPIQCASYQITPTGASAVVTYTYCDTNTSVTFLAEGVVTVCAAVGTVYAPDATVVNMGDCTTTTTTAIP